MCIYLNWGSVSLLQYYGKDRAEYFTPESPINDWCVYTESCNNQFKHELSSSCQIYVDPFVTSCIASSKFSPLSYEQKSKIVSYNLQIRTLKTERWDQTFSSIHQSICKYIEHITSKDSEISQQCLIIYEFIQTNILSVVCSWIPIYLANVVIAVIFLSVEDSVASHPLFRFFVAIVVGIFLGLLWVFLVIYRYVLYFYLFIICLFVNYYFLLIIIILV